MDYAVIILAGIFVFASGFMFQAKWLIRGALVGVLAVILGIYKEIRASDASAVAQVTISNLELTIEQQTNELEKQNEKLIKILRNQGIDQKYNETINYTLNNQKYLIKTWKSIFGYFEITRADCDFNITMHYEKNVDVMDELKIEEVLAFFGFNNSVKAKVLNILPVQDLRAKFQNSVRMKQNMSDLFGRGSVIDRKLVINHLVGVEGKSLLILPWIHPIVFDIQPAPEYENRDCKIGIYSP